MISKLLYGVGVKDSMGNLIGIGKNYYDGELKFSAIEESSLDDNPYGISYNITLFNREVDASRSFTARCKKGVYVTNELAAVLRAQGLTPENEYDKTSRFKYSEIKAFIEPIEIKVDYHF